MTRDNTDALIALAERCEQATGPDAALDLEIARVCGEAIIPARALPTERAFEFKRYPERAARNYTASLDAAMTLLDDSYVWGVSKQERNPGRDYYYQASAMPFGPIAPGEATAASPALALCAAALRARAAQ